MPFISGIGQAGRGFSGQPRKPGAPTSLSSIAGNSSLSISFTAPVDNGGLPITNYEYALSTNSGSTYGSWQALSPADAVSPITISSLTNGQAYYVKLRAVNAIGSGAESSALTTNTTPYNLPTATTDTGTDATTTPAAPTTNNATNLETFSASLTDVSYTSSSGTWTNPAPAGAATGTGTLNGSSGTTSFIYGTTSGNYPNEVTATSNAYAGTTWSRGTTIYYKAKITNTSCSATFKATVNAQGNTTTVTFEYGTSNVPGNANYLNSSIAGTSVTGNTNTATSATKTSLAAGTYYYRVKAVNDAGTTYGSVVALTISAKSSTGLEKSFTPPAITTIYNLALVGGGGGGGYGSGGGGGQVKWWASAAITGTVTYVVGVGGGYAEGTGRSTTGGTSQIKIGTTEYNAPGGEGGLSGYLNTGTHQYDGGASADNTNIYLGGTGYSNGLDKTYYRAGGGGAGSASNGGHAQAVTSGANPTTPMYGGCGGNAWSVYALPFAGGGGLGWGSNGSLCESHTLSMPGRGGNGADPNNFVLPPGESGNDGQVTFRYYAVVAA